MGFLDDLPSGALALLAVVLVVTFLIAIWLLSRLLKVYSVLRRAGLPRNARLVFWAAVIYLISPIDLIPDPVVLDDIATLFAAVTYLSSVARREGLLADDPLADGPVDDPGGDTPGHRFG